jgi:hypothetical protein
MAAATEKPRKPFAIVGQGTILPPNRPDRWLGGNWGTATEREGP